MEFGIIISILSVLCVGLFVVKLLQGKSRRNRLLHAGRVSTWDDVEKLPKKVNRIVLTNFGYGKEVWALPDNANDVDLELRSFKTGVLVFPRPRLSEVDKFCRAHAINLTRTVVKSTRLFAITLVLSLVAGFLAADSAAIRWGPLNGPGPLGADTAATFRGGSYTESALSEDTTLYRVYGGNAGPLGSYWTRTAPAGPLQSTIDSALNPAWGNTAQNVSTVVIPKGTTIYEGFAAPQGGLLGGGSQVYIPKVNPAWIVNP